MGIIWGEVKNRGQASHSPAPKKKKSLLRETAQSGDF